MHAYEELLAGRPEEFDWVVLDDETSAAAMCYTSGTTGSPKGVVYSHRSIYLHSMQVCMPDGFGMQQSDRVLLIVPMFHVLAWGTPYAAMMCGATLVMPDRFLTPEPLAALIEIDPADPGRWGADHLGRAARPPRGARRATCRRCGTRSSAARPARAR